MKKFLTIILLCFISTITFAKSDFVIAPKSSMFSTIYSKDVFENVRIETEKSLVYNEADYTCVATYNINVIDAETGRTLYVITRQASYTSSIAWATCDIAMAIAQQSAESALATMINPY